MIKDIFIRILIGIGAAVLVGIISSILRIKYRLLIAVICFIVAIILSFLINPYPPIVPSVIGYFEPDAKRIIQEAGLVHTVTYRSSSSENEGKVIQQDPKGGTRVEKGSTVNLIIGKRESIFHQTNSLGTLRIEFIRPQNSERVPQFTDVEYRVDGSIPQGYIEVLLVQDPLGQYWSWETPTGHRRTVQIGVSEDRDKEFILIVLITNQQIPKGIPYQSLPQGIYHKSITVIRQ